MKARLDHIGIAVQDVDAALAFYRDALGIEVTEVEDIAGERVRAHFLPVGEPALELLEPTAADSPIAKYMGKRGPGIHHITLRVSDIDATVARLQDKGVRLVDERVRIGAGGSRIAFIHPSAAQGVLVELKEEARQPVLALGSQRHALGQLELITVSDGLIHLDGGAMFGTVPRTLWQRRIAPDHRHRIPLAMRPLIVRGEQTLLIDAGCGDKMDAKSAEIYGLDRRVHLDHALAEAGLSADDIDVVLASHLHFDHVGGFTRRDESGAVVPRFPRARYIAHRGEWEDATHPHARSRASYIAADFVPLAAAGVLSLVDDETEVMPGVRLRRSGGHTRHHQVVTIESQGETAVFAADMYPTAAHVPDPWIMGYDLYPMDTLAFKDAFAREAVEREYLVFFEHDPVLAAGRLRQGSGTRAVERVI